tara:strand:+ start:5964 stop:11330 length:5367 start_codon:yes stop_codon:yes gene_type:complete
LRIKLLDLTARNTLLNFSFRQTNSIRLVDELPDQIAAVLADGQLFTFFPVPEPLEEELIEHGFIVYDEDDKLTRNDYPTAEQWAKIIGIQTSHDLPPAETAADNHHHHNDHGLQTLLYPPELDARLRNLRSRAETSIEEAGANILYLALGFLEWTEDDNSTRKYLSPLFTMPVELKRSATPDRNGVFYSTIGLKDDGLLTNITLREKIKQDFGLSIPCLQEEVTPERYFESLEHTILQQKPAWRLRRQASLVLLNFTKQAMYEDLDPNNWPASNPLIEHPIIAHLFGSAELDSGMAEFSYAEERAIDEIENVHTQFPIIYDADSSQHSALIDAVNGDNLVIEGPPGSGKSQTITNIIAANIANGKRVLFVAEKMAALNVVKDRLDRAGLGEFCLELHSHKTNKQKLLEALGVRLNHGRYDAPQGMSTNIERLETHRQKLSDYAELINSKWKVTGRSIHEILAAATRQRQEMSAEPDSVKIEGIAGENLSPGAGKALADDAALLADIYKQAAEQAKDGKLENHHWFGVRNIDLLGHQQQLLIDSLSGWNETMVRLRDLATKLSAELTLGLPEDLPIAELRQLAVDIPKLPDLLGREPLARLEEALPHLVRHQHALKLVTELHGVYEQYGTRVKPEVWGDDEKLILLRDAVGKARAVGLSDGRTMGFLLERFASLSGLSTRVTTLTERLDGVLERLPPSLKPWFAPTMIGLAEMEVFADLAVSLPTRLWRYRNPVFDEPDLDDLLSHMTAHLKPMVALHARVNSAFDLKRLMPVSQLSASQEVLVQGGVFRWFSSTWRTARKSVLDMALPTHRNSKTLVLLPELILYAEHQEHIIRLNNRDNSLQEYLEGPNTPIDDLNAVRVWYRNVREAYGRGFGDRSQLAEVLFTVERDTALGFADYIEKDLAADINAIRRSIQQYRQELPELPALTRDDQVLLKMVQGIHAILSDVLDPLHACLADDQETIAGASELAIALEHQVERLKELTSTEMQSACELLGLSTRAGEFSASQIASAQNFLAILHILAESSRLRNGLVAKPDAERYQRIRERWPSVASVLGEAESQWMSFKNSGQASYTQWAASTEGLLVPLIARNERALANPKWLETWLGYLRLRNRLAERGLSTIIRGLELQAYTPDQLPAIVQLAINHQLAEEIMSESKAVREANGMELTAVRHRFQEYDTGVMDQQRKMVAHRAAQVTPPAGRSTGRVSEYTELGLIRHNLNLQRPRVSVRGLITRSGQAIQALKPCFMMSPMSVAQYLEPGRHVFDLVVMDEASQIRPEDALGAIARGRSLIVVGDPKQLPPTSFFQRLTDDGDDDEDAVGLQQSQSILDCVIPMFKNRRLRWHYRSRHESLIAFSNQRFYNSDLVLFPSPFAEDDEFGVKFNRVRKGRFHGGKNTEEAKAVVSAAIDQLIRYPEESLGLVAMNAKQAEEIEMQLEQRLRDDPLAQMAYEKNQGLVEPLFIKNLENVQGDERDVIMISMTYGPGEVGSSVMAQRFGPINQDVGWRRLNVLFTRSKKRMVILSSMDSGHVRTSETSSRGVIALRAFLEYCETGRLTHHIHTGKSADSDFEVAVMDMLAAHGYTCEPQLGVAGYFLDLAVRDPGQPGRFLMGIECDGATYHSAKSARDRDRLRQSVLESLGWRIRRIWSTDWFKHPEAQLAPILEELEELRTPVSEAAQQPAFVSEPESDAATYIQDGLELEEILDDDTAVPLRERLRRFDKEVMRVKNPHTPSHRKLLRPEMLEVLLRVLPESKAEFQEKIPGFLRAGTASEEAVFLEEVLELIAIWAE